MILNKRILRELKENFLRYLALVLMIILGMTIVISLSAAAETVIKSTHDNAVKNNVEDGQFSVFVPLTDTIINELENKGVTIEKSFFLDYSAIENSTLRIFKNRQKINLIVPDTGNIPNLENDIFVEQNYAKAHDISVGDDITVGGVDFVVCGIGSAPDYECVKNQLSDIGVESEKFSIAFVSDSAYSKLKESGLADKTEEYLYSFLLNGAITSDELKDILTEGETPNLTMFLTAGDNQRIGGAADDVVINKISAIFGGVIILILFSYVIAVFVIHSIDRESQVIGALYSLGYVKKELLLHYLVLPTIIAFLGGAIGTLFGILTTASQYEESIIYFSYPAPENYFPAYLLAYGLVMPPLISLIVNFLVINKKLSQPPLTMLRREKKEHKISNVNLGKMSFVNRFRIRQMLREIRASLTLCGGMLISLLFMMIAVNSFSMLKNMTEQNKEDTKFSFMYTLKYPPEIIPEKGEACYAEALSKKTMGYDFDVTVMGIDDDNRYYDFDVSGLGENEIAVSSSAAIKYNVKAGDRLTLSDQTNDKNYSFEVKKIVQYSVGLYVFMDINSMRDYFGREGGFYNVLLSGEALEIDSNMLYSVVTYDDITGFAEIFSELMWGMIGSISIASVVVFIMVMFLMLKMMADRSALSVSLVKIFGYNDKEVNRLYLGGSFWTVLASSLICVPVSKLIMNSLFPFMVSNVGCGFVMTVSPVLYLLIFFMIFVSYFIINFILTRRLKKVSAAEVLKNRE
ncbi:MAG: ABC transporter permease [Oscillospiraceae bacterium]|jgi:putative ABC transport system permease protein